MKAQACAVLVLIAMAVCLDSVSADEEGSGPVAATSTCNLTVPAEINSKLVDCVIKEDSKFRDELTQRNTPDDYRLAFRNLCDNEPNLRQCIADVVAEYEGCLEGVEKTRFQLNASFIMTNMEVSCIDGGINPVTIEEEQGKPSNMNANGTMDVYSQCQLSTEAKYRHTESDEPNQDPNLVMKHKYLYFRDASECLQRLRGQGHDILVEAGVAHWSNVADRMKCVDTQSGAQVLCKTLFDTEGSN